MRLLAICLTKYDDILIHMAKKLPPFLIYFLAFSLTFNSMSHYFRTIFLTWSYFCSLSLSLSRSLSRSLSLSLSLARSRSLALSSCSLSLSSCSLSLSFSLSFSLTFVVSGLRGSRVFMTIGLKSMKMGLKGSKFV